MMLRWLPESLAYARMQARQDAEQLTTALDLALADIACGKEQVGAATDLHSQWQQEKPIWTKMETELARQVRTSVAAYFYFVLQCIPISLLLQASTVCHANGRN
jgi:hypothetical protein